MGSVCPLGDGTALHSFLVVGGGGGDGGDGLC